MEGYVDVGGVKAYYRSEGSGAAVILIHSNGLSLGQWKYNLGQFSKYYKVYAPDLPGFGLSDKPDAEYGVEYYVSFLRSFMDALGIPKAALVGSSLGGAVAASFAARYPGRATGLVLADPTGLVPDGISRNKELYNVFLSLMIRSRRLYCRPMFHDSSAMKALEGTQLVTDSKESRDAFVKDCKAILSYDPGYLKALMSITVPTLVLWGEDDLLLPCEDAQKYCELIPGSKVKVIEYCGHMPNVEKHQEFNSTVLDFLAGIRH
jgi:4,5:9,10-diseco-3-hydroxy-5,9,17-trioxoandrosta-1(10),2-diene-4-oate hydrolase